MPRRALALLQYEYCSARRGGGGRGGGERIHAAIQPPSQPASQPANGAEKIAPNGVKVLRHSFLLVNVQRPYLSTTEIVLPTMALQFELAAST